MKTNNDPFTKFEHDGWQRVAGQYESAWSGLTRLFIPALLDAVKATTGTQLLDVACGPGYVAEAAQHRGANAIGIDFSKEMVQLAKQRNPKIEFQIGDAQALDFEDKSFNAVAMNFGLLHLARPEAAFAEAFRVLRAGGYYGFTVWAGPEFSPGAKLVEDAVTAHAQTNVELPKGPDYFGYGDPDSCGKALGATGFREDSLTFETVTGGWEVPTASFIFESELHAGVRTAALLAAQSPEILSAIKSQIEQSAKAFKTGNGFVVPYAAHVISIRKR